jgi:hypothetical protein
MLCELKTTSDFQLVNEVRVQFPANLITFASYLQTFPCNTTNKPLLGCSNIKLYFLRLQCRNQYNVYYLTMQS